VALAHLPLGRMEARREAGGYSAGGPGDGPRTPGARGGPGGARGHAHKGARLLQRSPSESTREVFAFEFWRSQCSRGWASSVCVHPVPPRSASLVAVRWRDPELVLRPPPARACHTAVGACPCLARQSGTSCPAPAPPCLSRLGLGLGMMQPRGRSSAPPLPSLALCLPSSLALCLPSLALCLPSSLSLALCLPSSLSPLLPHFLSSSLPAFLAACLPPSVGLLVRLHGAQASYMGSDLHYSCGLELSRWFASRYTVQVSASPSRHPTPPSRRATPSPPRLAVRPCVWSPASVCVLVACDEGASPDCAGSAQVRQGEMVVVAVCMCGMGRVPAAWRRTAADVARMPTTAAHPRAPA
jgi:hypothetical protein